MLVEVRERNQKLDCKAPYQPHTQSLERVALNELVQINAQQLKRYTLSSQKSAYQVLAKEEVLFHFDGVLVVVGVVPLQCLQHPHFHHRLAMESLLISDYFECDVLFLLVVEALKHLPERPLSQSRKDLEAVHDVVVDVHLDVPALVIEPVIGFLRSDCRFLAVCRDEPNFLEI